MLRKKISRPKLGFKELKARQLRFYRKVSLKKNMHRWEDKKRQEKKRQKWVINAENSLNNYKKLRLCKTQVKTECNDEQILFDLYSI